MNAGGGIEELAFDAGTEEDFKKKRDSRIQFYKNIKTTGSGILVLPFVHLILMLWK